MVKLLRIALPLAATLVAAQPSLAARRPSRPSHASAFDGRWSVEVITERGTCDQAYRWSVGIKDDRIADIGDQVAQASGGVDRRGRLTARFTRGADVLTARGSLSGKWGRGLWSAPSLACSGRWVAERGG